jgi:hypothetical protein
MAQNSASSAQEELTEKNYHRSQLIIHRSLQLKLVGHSMLICFLGALSTHILDFVLTSQAIVIPMIGSVRSVFLVLIPAALLWYCFLWGMVVTNRVAGPIFRITKHMMDVLKGVETSPVVIRKNDYFQDLAQSYNQLLEKHVFKNPNKDEVA